MSKPLLNIYEQQNPDASCQLSNSILGCVPKLNNRNGDNVGEQDNGSGGFICDPYSCGTIGERINEAIWENCRRNLSDAQSNSKFTDKSNNYISTKSRKVCGKSYIDKTPVNIAALDSKLSGITAKFICEHKNETSAENTNQLGGLNINSQTEISLFNAATKKEMQSTNRNFAPNILQNVEVSKTATLSGVESTESKCFPSDGSDSSQTLHVVLLDVSNPDTYQKKSDTINISNLRAAVPTLLQHESDSQTKGNLNTVSIDQRSQFNKSSKCGNKIDQQFNNLINFQISENNRKRSFDDSKTESDSGNRASLNMPAVFMNSPSIRRNSVGASNLCQSDSAVLQDKQMLEQVPINKKIRQTVKDKFNVCVPSPAHPSLKNVFLNNLQIEPVTKQNAVSATDNEDIVCKECIECTAVGARSMTSHKINRNFTATQTGRNNAAVSGSSTLNPQLRPKLVMSPVLNQENKAGFSNRSHCFVPRPAQVLTFPSQEVYLRSIQKQMGQMQAKQVQNVSTMARSDQQIQCMVNHPNLFQSVCMQPNQFETLGQCNGENNLMQFRNHILLQQLQELHNKRLFECHLPTSRHIQNTQDLNCPHVTPNNEIGNPVNTRAPHESDNFVKAFQSLLPNLKASLSKVFITSSEAISQNITAKSSEGNFVNDFENSLEDLMAILDSAEIHLKSAKEMQMQSFLDNLFIPYYCQDQVPSKTYSLYRSVAINQIGFVQEICDTMLFSDSFRDKKNNSKEH